MPTKTLVDSSFLYALSDQSDKYRPQAVHFLQTVKAGELVVPDVALTEVTHLLMRHVSYHAAFIFIKTFAKLPFELQPVTKDELDRVSQIMERYATAKFDFVDCCIMALAAQLNITRICTFDRRDFSIYKPTHCEKFDLLP